MLSYVRIEFPGYRFALEYKRFDISSEGEYLFDEDDSDGNYFYSWTEAGYSPLDWLRVGVVGQRTRIFDRDARDIDRGLFVTVTVRNIAVTAYTFEPWDDDDRFWVFGVGAGF